MKDALYYHIDAWNDDTLSDGAWWATLENAVTTFNAQYGCKLDEHDTVHKYLARKEAEQNE